MNFGDTLVQGLTGRTIAAAKVSDIVGDLATNLIVAALILAATLWVSGWAAKLVLEGLKRWRRTRGDPTLQEFASSVVRYGVLVVGVTAMLRRLGVETASIITVLGAASLAIGLALQGALSNVAAGVMILVFRPYHVGDHVTIAGKSGRVRHLDLFNTEIRDADNVKIVVPNGKAFGDVVTNYSDMVRRRIELNIGIDYDDDIGKAIEVAKRCAAEDPRILPDPAPWAKATELAASSVTITLRAWTTSKWEDYWDTRFDLVQRLKESFDREGLHLPYPAQMAINKYPEGRNFAMAAEPEAAAKPDRAKARA